MQKNAWDFQKSLEDIIEDKITNEMLCSPPLSPDANSEETMSYELHDSQTSEDSINSSTKEFKSKKDVYNLPRLIEKIFQRRKKNNKLNQQNARKTYEYNAIDNTGDRMITGGIGGEDAS